jgi:hypothetical protein
MAAFSERVKNYKVGRGELREGRIKRRKEREERRREEWVDRR